MEEVFRYFLNFIKNACPGITVEDTPDNKKEFLTKIDEDKSLSVDFDELNNFFDSYINIAAGKVNLSMASGTGNAKSSFAPIKFKLEVLEDFEDGSEMHEV